MKSFIVKSLSAATVIFSIAFSSPAFANTVCTKTVSSVTPTMYGTVWIHYEDGSSSHVLEDHATQKYIFSLATTAVVTGNPVLILYNETGCDCMDDGRTDVEGFRLLKE
ncbi:MAG: hypothetical protein GY874_10935 [Desulfobacteraceae bacterium]|nr:hypothetical protein [Desulfobacteraceae bacterium]